MPKEIPEPYTSEMLASVIAALETECARLLAVKTYMDVKKVEKLDIKHSLSLKRKGIPGIAGFAHAAVDAMREHQLEG